MAIIIMGKSTCSICEKVMLKNDVLTAFPAFLPRDHKFNKFSDAAFHESCFLSLPESEKVEAFYTAYKMIYDSKPKNLKTLEENESWAKEAFKDWPPKNGVIIFQQLYSDDSEPESFYMDEDSYNDMIAAEEEQEKRHLEYMKREQEEEYENLKIIILQEELDRQEYMRRKELEEKEALEEEKFLTSDE